RDGTAAGYTTSGSYGHTVGGGLGMGYVKGPADVTDDWLRAGRYELLVDGRRWAARLHLRAPHDPDRRRVLG
ncbi:MAG: glycine cleavage T C-terminal barrel domain-containing protein, partial [Verrucomicrobiota bacterium]